MIDIDRLRNVFGQLCHFVVSGDTFPSSNYWMGSVLGNVTPGADFTTSK